MRTEYLFNKASFDGLVYDDVKFIQIKGSKFTISDPQVCLNGTTINNIKKFIEANGGEVTKSCIKSADYLIITPQWITQHGGPYTYVKEQQKYEKAVECRSKARKPLIIRDVDFYIICNLFTKLSIDEKRRVVLEYVNENANFNGNNTKKVLEFIAKNANSDAILRDKDILNRANAVSNKQGQEGLKIEIPEGEDAPKTLQQWRKYFSISYCEDEGEKWYTINKLKAQNSIIKIPSHIEGIEVALDRKTFYNIADSVKEIVLPDTIDYIGNYTFADCKGLEKVIINANSHIGYYAFSNCPNLKEVIMEGKNIIKERWKTDEF